MKCGILISPATINPPIIHSIDLVLWPDYTLLERQVSLRDRLRALRN